MSSKMTLGHAVCCESSKTAEVSRMFFCIFIHVQSQSNNRLSSPSDEPAPERYPQSLVGYSSPIYRVRSCCFFLSPRGSFHRHHLCRSFSSMSVAACPLSKSPVFNPRLPVDLEALEEVLTPAVDDGRLLVDLADLKNAPKVPRLDVDF